MSRQKLKVKFLEQKTSSHVKMRDIAQQAGVSVVTVSRVLNHPDKVAPETRERVIATIKKFNYIPDMLAGSMASRKSYAVGVIIPTITNSLFADTIDGLFSEIEPAGYQLMIGSSRYDPAREAAIVRTMISRRVDSIVLTGTTHFQETIDVLASAGIPVFEMWNLTDNPIDTIIGFSNRQATKQMTLHLNERGYCNIGYLGGLTFHNDRTADREAGFLDAMLEIGDDSGVDRIFRTDFDFPSGSAGILALKSLHPEMDAIMAASDVLAVGAMLECQRQGWRVPKDIAIAGLDDSVIASQLTPALTTVKLPRYEIGRKVGQQLLARLSGKSPESRRIDLGFEIVLRDST